MIYGRKTNIILASTYTLIHAQQIEIPMSDVLDRIVITAKLPLKGFNIIKSSDGSIVGQIATMRSGWRKPFHLYIPRKDVIIPLETPEFNI